jgi:hypothetical protein
MHFLHLSAPDGRIASSADNFALARRRGLAGSLSDFVLLIDALFPMSRFYGGCSAPQWRMPFTDSIGLVVTKQLPPRWP